MVKGCVDANTTVCLIFWSFVVAIPVGYVILTGTKTNKQEKNESASSDATGANASWKKHLRIHTTNDMRVQPTTRLCFYCKKEGNELPVERFTRVICCGHHICINCSYKYMTTSCGECLTCFPEPRKNYPALSWIATNNDKIHTYKSFIVGKIMILGQHLFVDEVNRLPLYGTVTEPCSFMQALNPPSIDRGIIYLKSSANQQGYVPAMIALGDVYAMHKLDPEKAEEWYTKALGHGKQLSPIAFTRFGLFLQTQSGRAIEAMDMFRVASELNHVVGQYEYAKCLLKNISTSQEVSAGSTIHGIPLQNQQLEAIKWLCKASEKGFVVESTLLLAETLIEFVENLTPDGRADTVGRSPLPRAFQILKHAEAYDEESSKKRIELQPNTGSYRDHQQKKIQSLKDRYTRSFTHCANCGEEETTDFPFVKCSVCGVMRYCDKLCRKTHYKDGHKSDCCSETNLYRYDLLERWLIAVKSSDEPKTEDVCDDVRNEASISNKSITRLVEDFTDELNEGEDEDYNAEKLARLMRKMGVNLEKYLDTRLSVICESRPSNGEKKFLSLAGKIDKFAKHESISSDFKTAMLVIKDLRNTAAHTGGDPLSKVKCDEALRHFFRLKELHENEIKK